MSKALPNLPMAETVLIRLIRVSVSTLGDFFEPVFREIGMAESSFHVLCLLQASDRGHASPSELSDLVGTSRANMTRILDDLISSGLASRELEERDGRRRIIRITSAGRKAARQAVPRLVVPLKSAFAGLTPKEFAQFDALLRKVISSFDKGGASSVAEETA